MQDPNKLPLVKQSLREIALTALGFGTGNYNDAMAEQLADLGNDKVDAGEIGAGHDVTALYEITLVNSGGESVDPLRYAKSVATPSRQSDEIGWLRWRPTLLATTAGAIAPSS